MEEVHKQAACGYGILWFPGRAATDRDRVILEPLSRAQPTTEQIMSQKLTRRQALAAGAVLSAGALAGDAPPKLPPAETYTGKVKPLAEIVAQIGSKLDSDAAAHWLALVTEDGKIYPLIKDSGARMFFADKRLLDRPMRLRGR